MVHPNSNPSVMESYISAADPKSSQTIQQRIDTLFNGCRIVSSFGLSWCSLESPEIPSFLRSDKLTDGSEEQHQLIRAQLRVDDIATIIFGESQHLNSKLEPTALVNLYWSLAVLGLYHEATIKRIQKLIADCSSRVSEPEHMSKVLFAEATFFHHNSSVSFGIDEGTFSSLSLHLQVNMLQCLSIISKDVRPLTKLRKCLVSAIVRNHKEGGATKESLDIIVPFAARLISFINALTNQEGHHDINKLKSISILANRLPPWKYAFEVCLACHAVASKGVELNPFVDQVFPTDVVFLPTGSKKKLVIELVRPSSVVWRVDATETSVYGIDLFSRMTRTALAAKGYRVVAITLTEWLKLGGDKAKQMSYVKRRIRNCMHQRRLFKGMERDELVSDFDVSESSDSDMSD